MNQAQQPNEAKPARKARGHFDDAFRRQAVELSYQGKRTVRELAAELGIREWTLTKWRRRYGEAAPQGGPMSAAAMGEEIKRLRAEVSRLREREIVLKKSLGILSETPGSGMPSYRP